MAGFTENLKVEIESIFNSAGFDKLQAELKQTQTQLAATFGQVKKMRAMRREARKFGSVMERAGLAKREKGDAPFSNLASGAGRKGSPVDAEKATQRMARAMGEMEMVSAGLSQNVGNVNSHMQEAANAAVNTLGGIESSGFADTMSTRKFQETTRSTNRLGKSFRRARSGAVRLGAGIGAVGSALSSAAPAARKLQMRLLGLQFTMLTVAFIFGGLMAGALGAVGVFEVLGNTLKFLFLPTALNVLGGVLGIQEAVMSMDEETRQLIGDIFFWISAFAIVIGLAAALGKAVLSLVGFLKVLGGVFKFIGAFLNIFGVGISTVAGLIAGLLGFLGGLVAGFLIVTKVAAKFGKKVALIVGSILVVLGAALALIASAPLTIAAAVGLAIGALIGLLVTFKDEVFAFIGAVIGLFVGFVKGVIGLFFGLIDFIVNDVVGGFVQMGKDIFNLLFGGSIFPDLINGIIGLFKDLVKFVASLPLKFAKIALNLGKAFVKAIVKGINAVGGMIWDALKSFLPSQVVDALEAAGGFVKGGINVAGDLAGGVANAAGNLAGGAANAVSDLFGGGDNTNTNQTNVQQNNINAEVQVNDKEETPQETGREFGRGAADGLNQRANNNASGF